jgi:hypothetical protein
MGSCTRTALDLLEWRAEPAALTKMTGFYFICDLQVDLGSLLKDGHIFEIRV